MQCWNKCTHAIYHVTQAVSFLDLVAIKLSLFTRFSVFFASCMLADLTASWMKRTLLMGSFFKQLLCGDLSTPLVSFGFQQHHIVTRRSQTCFRQRKPAEKKKYMRILFLSAKPTCLLWISPICAINEEAVESTVDWGWIKTHGCLVFLLCRFTDIALAVSKRPSVGEIQHPEADMLLMHQSHHSLTGLVCCKRQAVGY